LVQLKKYIFPPKSGFTGQENIKNNSQDCFKTGHHGKYLKGIVGKLEANGQVKGRML
jgi:hypothetical protein